MSSPSKAQASSLYLFFYYLGSSISGTVGGFFWLHFGWGGITALITTLLLLAFIAAESLSAMEFRTIPHPAANGGKQPRTSG